MNDDKDRIMVVLPRGNPCGVLEGISAGLIMNDTVVSVESEEYRKNQEREKREDLAFLQGSEAYRGGIAVTDIPYDLVDVEYYYWRYGWFSESEKGEQL